MSWESTKYNKKRQSQSCTIRAGTGVTHSITLRPDAASQMVWSHHMATTRQYSSESTHAKNSRKQGETAHAGDVWKKKKQKR